MFAVMGATGKVGGAAARLLHAAGQPVRVVVRDEAKGRPWAARGCLVAEANLEFAVKTGIMPHVDQAQCNKVLASTIFPSDYQYGEYFP